MRLIACLLAAAALAGLAPLARAQPINGLYVSGSFGAAFPQGRVVTPVAPSESPAPVSDGAGSAGQLRLPHWP